MIGNRLTKRELFIIERTKREGELLHADEERAGTEAEEGSQAPAAKKRSGRTDVARFYVWFVSIFVALAVAISLLLIFFPEK